MGEIVVVAVGKVFELQFGAKLQLCISAASSVSEVTQVPNAAKNGKKARCNSMCKSTQFIHRKIHFKTVQHKKDVYTRAGSESLDLSYQLINDVSMQP
jgi:hypothetical protein